MNVRTTIVSAMSKTALVTGASTGIGYELCRLLAKDGYELFLVARNAGKLEQVAAEMRTSGSPAAKVIVADLSQGGSAARVTEALGGTVPDVLINNAGFGLLGRFSESELTPQLDMIHVNVTSLVELTHRLLPAMLQRRSGRILNIASTAAFQPGPAMAVYFATKSFVLHFSEAIAEETRGSGVTVTAFCPGATNTQFQGRARMTETKLFTRSVMSAEDVAALGYAAMMKGKVLSIAGLGNRLGVQGLRLAPRSIVRRITHGLLKTF